ncbi:MAG: CoA-binding protein, partial [Thermoplasmata archaeon]
MSDGLSTLLNPRSVAVVGASANPSKLGNVILKNLKTGRFRLYPVNPKEESIEGLKCYRSVGEVPDEIDLAVIALPAEATIQPFLECVAKGVKHIIVTASGFRESGEAGAVLESQLVDALRGSRTR